MSTTDGIESVMQAAEIPGVWLPGHERERRSVEVLDEETGDSDYLPATA